MPRRAFARRALWPFALVVALVLVLASCATQPPPALPLPPEHARAVDYARNMGTLLYRHERAGQRAQALLDDAGMATPADALGWVTEQIDGDGSVQVTFVAGPAANDTAWRAWARAIVRPPNQPGHDVQLAQVNPALSGFERDKLRARRTAQAQAVEDCGGTARVAVLSWRLRGRDVFLAYRLGTLDAGSERDGALIGGQYEFTLDPHGRTVLARERGEGACTVASRARAPRRLLHSTNARAAPAWYDVYTSLHEGLPLQLDTLGNGLRWRVDGDRVRLLCRAPCEGGDR